MGTTATSSVNYTAGKFLRMQELKNQFGETIYPDEFLYKNTMIQVKREMKSVFGQVLLNIPKAFIHNNCIWKASITRYQHKGRTFESFRFLPMYGLKNA